MRLSRRLTAALAVSFGILFAMAGPSRVWAQQVPDARAFRAPVAWQVYQRDAAGKARVEFVLAGEGPALAVTQARVTVGASGPGQGRDVPAKRDGNAIELPTGGPYQIEFAFTLGEPERLLSGAIGPIFVGDLWVLAGQSNMEGVGDLLDVQPPDPRVALLAMDGVWKKAEEPLHWLVDSPDPVHSGDTATRADRAAQQRKTRTKGAGLGLPFAAALTRATGVPIGLVACAHGGTSMAQWDPARKGDGGASLYGSMLRQVKLAGGRVKGVLWYQGESDAMGPPAVQDGFAKTFADFIAAVRADLESPDLPFLYVQIGRFIRAGDPRGWNVVQEAQRVLPDLVPGTAVVSVIDLELDDLIHVGTQGLKRAGGRLARVAERLVYGRAGATTPALARAYPAPGNAIRVEFRGVNLGLEPARHIAGFSIRDESGAEIPSIYEAAVGPAPDAVTLKLIGPLPPGARLWYGYGLDPHCNLVDRADMAVPAFGPITPGPESK